MSHLVTLLWATAPSQNKCFWLLSSCYGPVQTLKLDYIAWSSVQLSNHAHNKAMHNVSVHKLPWYYQPYSRYWFSHIGKLLTRPCICHNLGGIFSIKMRLKREKSPKSSPFYTRYKMQPFAPGCQKQMRQPTPKLAMYYWL